MCTGLRRDRRNCGSSVFDVIVGDNGNRPPIGGLLLRRSRPRARTRGVEKERA